MNTMKQIQDAIKRLSPEKLAEFRAWFAEFDAKLCDRQIEQDAAAGKLDALARQALAEFRAGLTQELDPDRL